MKNEIIKLSIENGEVVGVTAATLNGVFTFVKADSEPTVLASGTKEWRLNGRLHRTDGPAVERYTGSNEWWVNGVLHRTDGPAIERCDGSTVWRVNGLLHRTDGPAIERCDGSKEWWVNGVRRREGGESVAPKMGDAVKAWDKDCTNTPEVGRFVCNDADLRKANGVLIDNQVDWFDYVEVVE